MKTPTVMLVMMLAFAVGETTPWQLQQRCCRRYCHRYTYLNGTTMDRTAASDCVPGNFYTTYTVTVTDANGCEDTD